VDGQLALAEQGEGALRVGGEGGGGGRVRLGDVHGLAVVRLVLLEVAGLERAAVLERAGLVVRDVRGLVGGQVRAGRGGPLLGAVPGVQRRYPF